MGPDDVTATVTLERRYFETLARRAQLRASDVPVTQSLPQDVVAVSRSELNALSRTSRQYANLCGNLLRGGVEEFTIQLLSQDDAAIGADTPVSETQYTRRQCPPDNAPVDAASSPAPDARPLPRSHMPHAPPGGAENGNWPSPAVNAPHERDFAEAEGEQGEQEGLSSPVDGATDFGTGELAPGAGGAPTFDRQCTRTVQLLGLPDSTTYADVAGVVRGGILLDIFLRSHDRSATVSFLNASEARVFFDHCRKNDVYVRNKRVEVRWADRQFVLAGHVASKIATGATRNLVIRRCDPRITEEALREDLAHIHNLVVIKVAFIGSTCYISTNSVHNAMFARMCMMSRLKFKGSRIEWDADECAQPLLGNARQPSFSQGAPPSKKLAGAIANRFQLLVVDEEDDDGAALSHTSREEIAGMVV